MISHWRSKKAQKALDLGVDAIMDLSNYGDTKNFRRANW